MAYSRFVPFPMCGLLLFILLFRLSTSSAEDERISTEEITAQNYLQEIMPSIKKNLIWGAELNFKDRAKISFVDELGLEYELKEIAHFLQNITEKLKQYSYENFKNETLKREITLVIVKDYKILPTVERIEMEDLLRESESISSQVKVCSYYNRKECNLRFWMLYYHMYISSNDALQWYWEEWRNKAGKLRRAKFDRFVELYRKAATLNGFITPSEMMLTKYEDPDIIGKLNEAVEQLRPLYAQLHAYFRHKLRKDYGNTTILGNEPIPQHLIERFSIEFDLNDLDPFYYPYPDTPLLKFDDAMSYQNYTPTKMLSQADEMFKSMGFQTILKGDWRKSVQISAPDSTTSCTTKAASFYEQKSFYFTLCKHITFDNFLRIHGETLDVHHHFLSSQLPFIFRPVYTEVFQQALREAVVLSVSSNTYLIKLGLAKSSQVTPESAINRLYNQALQVIIPIFESFVETKYLADIIDGKVNSSDSNCAYWRLQDEYFGVKPPVERSQLDFDAIASKLDGYEQGDLEDVFSKIVSFKIYEGLCKYAGQYSEGSSKLSECDLSGSKQVGSALIDSLSQGSRLPWQDLLKYLTNDTIISGSSILNYFRPLQNWLEEYNNNNEIHVGWQPSEMCK